MAFDESKTTEGEVDKAHEEWRQWRKKGRGVTFIHIKCVFICMEEKKRDGKHFFVSNDHQSLQK